MRKPFLSLSIDTDISADTDLLGKVVGDLQSNITHQYGGVKGTLKYVTGYTGFSPDPTEQSGNYICLHATAVDGATITAKYVGGRRTDTITLDADGLLIIHVTNKDGYIEFTATKDTVTQTKRIALSDLELLSA